MHFLIVGYSVFHSLFFLHYFGFFVCALHISHGFILSFIYFTIIFNCFNITIIHNIKRRSLSPRCTSWCLPSYSHRITYIPSPLFPAFSPKVITNKATKGKYKFLQKYYHRGAFFLDGEEDVLKRDFSGATLEDHFDKTILPKVRPRRG